MGGLLNSRPTKEPAEPDDNLDDLFTGSLVVSDPRFEKRRVGTGVSLAVHVLILGSVVLLPILWPEALPDLPCVFIITTTGCILQGDRFNIEIDLAPDTHAHVTTQAATKIHSMDANYAAQTQSIVLGENAYLEYLPDPVIPHRHARFITSTHVCVPSSSTLLYSEILMGGRKYHGEGELFEYDVFSSTVQATRPDGAELFTEKFVIEPHVHNVRQVGVMGTFDVFANVVLLTPKHHADKIFDQVPAGVNLEEQWAAGASRLPNDAGLVFKVLGQESEPVQAKVREFWSIVRQTVTGAPVLPKFVWR
jgi:urease accessory protein